MTPCPMSPVERHALAFATVRSARPRLPELAKLIPIAVTVVIAAVCALA